MSTKYVATTGSNANAGTIGAPYLTLNYAGTQLAAGDTLYVRAGIYAEILEGSNFPQGTSTGWGTTYAGCVKVMAYPGESVWIKPAAAASYVMRLVLKSYHLWDGISLDGSNMSGDNANLEIHSCDHVRIQHSNNYKAPWTGIHCGQSSGLNSYNEFVDLSVTLGNNVATGAPGHGFYFATVTANAQGTDHHHLVDGCYVQGFTRYTNDGGITIYGGTDVDRLGGITVRNCLVTGNSIGIEAGYATTVPNLFYNNSIYANTYDGAWIYSSSSDIFYNNTIHGNGEWGLSIGANYAVYNAIVKNNSISSNGSGPIKVWTVDALNKATVAYNNFSGNGNGNVISDGNGLSTPTNHTTVAPAYTNAGTYDFSLTSGSGLRDIGTTLASVTTDQIGTTRPQGSAYDIGAFEFSAVGGGGGGGGDVTLELVGLALTVSQGYLTPSGGAVPAAGPNASQCRAGIARSGLERSNYYSTVTVPITINGVDRSTSIIRDSMTIHQAINDEPDTARFTLEPGATIPTCGQAIVINLGALGNPIFAGQVMRVRHVRRVMPDTSNQQAPFVEVECVDWTALLDRRVINAEWTNLSATTIAQAIISTWTSGFTSVNVAAGLPTIDYFPCTNEQPSAALRRLMNLMGGGGYYIDVNRDLHLFPTTGETGIGAPTNPLVLTNTWPGTPATRTGMYSFAHTYDLSQVRNQIVGEGQRTTCSIALDAGATSFPVADAEPFLSAGKARVGTERVTFAGLASNVPGPDVLIGYASGGAVGGTTLDVVYGDVPSSMPDYHWIKVGDQYLYWTGSTGSGPSYTLTGIPASGMGAITLAITATTLFSFSDYLTCVPLAYDHPAGTDVVLLAQVDDFASQSALAVIEGGTGVHEFVVSDERLSYLGARERADQDRIQFAGSGGVITLEYDTNDLNAVVGARQVVNITTPDSIGSTLTIISVELTFPLLNKRPTRHCEASTLVYAPAWVKVDTPGDLFF